jgi:hypothetical protein
MRFMLGKRSAVKGEDIPGFLESGDLKHGAVGEGFVAFGREFDDSLDAEQVGHELGDTGNRGERFGILG